MVATFTADHCYAPSTPGYMLGVSLFWECVCHQGQVNWSNLMWRWMELNTGQSKENQLEAATNWRLGSVTPKCTVRATTKKRLKSKYISELKCHLTWLEHFWSKKKKEICKAFKDNLKSSKLEFSTKHTFILTNILG